MPENCPGDCQFDIVEGDWAGELSSFSECPAELWGIEDPGWGAVGSIPSGMCFKCPKCFSSIFKRPSLVKGLGRTSFMPVSWSILSVALISSLLTVLEVHRDIITAYI